MSNLIKKSSHLMLILLLCSFKSIKTNIPLFFWHTNSFMNFGDHLSQKLVDRILGYHIKICPQNYNKKKLLAIGSILTRAYNNDVVWGSGIKRFTLKDYKFKKIDVRAVRGPITQQFLSQTLRIKCPKIYGDPALLIPYLFPEFKKSKNPKYEYIIIPHYREQKLFPKSKYPNAVYPTEPWNNVIKKICDAKFVISSSLHGIIVAEAFGIPSRMLRITNGEPLLKYEDYYLGTGRDSLTYATSIEEALHMGGESPYVCDLQTLYKAFPFDCFPKSSAKEIDFEK